MCARLNCAWGSAPRERPLRASRKGREKWAPAVLPRVKAGQGVPSCCLRRSWAAKRRRVGSSTATFPDHCFRSGGTGCRDRHGPGLTMNDKKDGIRMAWGVRAIEAKHGTSNLQQSEDFKRHRAFMDRATVSEEMNDGRASSDPLLDHLKRGSQLIPVDCQRREGKAARPRRWMCSR